MGVGGVTLGETAAERQVQKSAGVCKGSSEELMFSGQEGASENTVE